MNKLGFCESLEGENKIRKRYIVSAFIKIKNEIAK